MLNEYDIGEIVRQVVAKLNIRESGVGMGIFEDMNEAIAAAKKAQAVLRVMSMDQREKIISRIRQKILENAETLARMAVEETGMGNVGHKILKNRLVAEKTPGTEDITTVAWSGDRGLTLIEMGPFGVIGADHTLHESQRNRAVQQHRLDRRREHGRIQRTPRRDQNIELRRSVGQ